MNGRSTVLGIQPNRGPNALPSPDGSSPAKELTIGSYGCVVTFFARLASTISGLEITPEIINQYCIDNNLFDVDTSDVIGFLGPAGTYVSLTMKYNLKLAFKIADFEMFLRRQAVHEWKYSLQDPWGYYFEKN